MNRSATMLTDEEKFLVDQCALQLRVIQADAVKLPAPQRQEYLADAISQSFKGCTTTNRERLLHGLLERFPVAGRIVQNAGPRVAETVPVRDTPETLLEKLIQSLDSVPMEQRAQMAKRLAENGLSVEKGGSSSLDLQLAPELLQKLGLSREQSLDLERLVLMAVTLIQLLNELDRTAQSTLREIKRQQLQPHDLAALAGQYLSGGVDNFEHGLRPTTSLLGALMAAILGGGREFGRQFSQKFSPEMIEQIVEAEGKKGFMGPSADERCWQKYKKLYRDVESPDAVDRWLKDCLAKILDLGGRAAK